MKIVCPLVTRMRLWSGASHRWDGTISQKSWFHLYTPWLPLTPAQPLRPCTTHWLTGILYQITDPLSSATRNGSITGRISGFQICLFFASTPKDFPQTMHFFIPQSPTLCPVLSLSRKKREEGGKFAFTMWSFSVLFVQWGRNGNRFRYLPRVRFLGKYAKAITSICRDLCVRWRTVHAQSEKKVDLLPQWTFSGSSLGCGLWKGRQTHKGICRAWNSNNDKTKTCELYRKIARLDDWGVMEGWKEGEGGREKGNKQMM